MRILTSAAALLSLASCAVVVARAAGPGAKRLSQRNRLGLPLELVGDAFDLLEQVKVTFPHKLLEQKLTFELHASPLFATGYAEQHVVAGEILRNPLHSNTVPSQHYRGCAKGANIAFSVIDGTVTGLVVFSSMRQVQLEHVLGSEHTVFRELQGSSQAEGQVVDSVHWPEPPQVVHVGGRGDAVGAAVVQTFAVPDRALYVEVLAVNDAERLRKFGGNESQAAEDTASIFNQAALLFMSTQWGGTANITIVLSGQVHWHENPFESEAGPPDRINNNGNVTANTYSPKDLLGNLSDWRNANLEDLLHHDALFLLTGKELTGETAGVAYLGAICDDASACASLDPGFCYSDLSLGCCLRSSTGLSQLIADDPLTTMYIASHEIGHMLGFEHDADAGATIMQGTTYSDPSSTPIFSAQSIATFQLLVNSSATGTGHYPYSCLANRPSAHVQIEHVSSEPPTASGDQAVLNAAPALRVSFSMLLCAASIIPF